MYPFEGTILENVQGSFGRFRDFFEEQGYVIGGNWDYHQGYFDKQLDDEQGYLFVRIPVSMVEGEFGDDAAQLRIGTPFALRHMYNQGIDGQEDIGLVSASFNQFQKPIDPDASLDEEQIEQAKAEVKRLEQAFQATFPH